MLRAVLTSIKANGMCKKLPGQIHHVNPSIFMNGDDVVMTKLLSVVSMMEWHTRVMRYN